MRPYPDDSPPPVTVSDPARAALPSGEVLAAPPNARRPARTRVPLVVVALLAAAFGARLIGAPGGATAALLGLDGRQSVYLSVSATGHGSYRLQVPFRLLNQGSAAATVVSATVPGSLLSTTGPAHPLEAGAAGQLVLEQPVTCRSGRPPVVPDPAARMRVQVRADGVQHAVTLSLPPEPRSSVAEELNRLCGWVPVPEAVRFVAGPVRSVHGQQVVALTMFNSSAQLIRLTGLATPSAALRLALQDGRPLRVELPPAHGPWPLPDGRASSVHLELAIALAAPGCTRQVPDTLALVTVDHGRGTQAAVLHPPDDRRVLAELLLAGCR